MAELFDAVVVGGGHNGLVAAAYLARAGRSVLVLERSEEVGGAVASAPAFAGVDVRLSRYSYLVSLLPDRIAHDLDLRVELRSRSVASYTPVGDGGLLVEREPGPATAESFARLLGSEVAGRREFDAWQRFYGELAALSEIVAPTMLEPLCAASKVRHLIGESCWDRFVESPLGEVIEQTFADDAVRGAVLTDGLIGIDTWAHDPSGKQNRCFLYHLVGNGTGEWRVPVGGMGAVGAALERAVRVAGGQIRTRAEVVGIDSDGTLAEVTYTDGALGHAERRVAASHVLSGVAPATLDILLGRTPTLVPEGAQMKVNLVLTRLPALRSGIDPRKAFAGTFHLDEGYTALASAREQTAAGRFPDVPPAELYCHTLTDRAILGPEPDARGWHTMTLFGLQTPARLFNGRNAELSERAVEAYLSGLNAYLAEPIEDCLARDVNGMPCIEAKTPLDIEQALGMPGGHIFHGDLSWPWAVTEDQEGTWGVETDIPNVLICGAGSVRGGGVSGIGGHNAAHAILTNDPFVK